MDMTPKEISKLLAKDAETLARRFLSGGKKSGNSWIVGNVDGEKGGSMSLALAGEFAGYWTDFATGERGDLIDLWRVNTGMTIGQTLEEIRKYLGIRHDEWKKPKVYAVPKRPEKTTKPNQPVIDWLHGRGISDKAIEAYKLEAVRQNGADWVLFPYLFDGAARMIKARSIVEKKIFPTSKDQEPCLFGWQAIPDSARWVALVEGEIDCVSLYEFGIPALSVPFGGGTGGKHNWLENEYNALQRFDTIYLCLDMDEVGKAATRELYARLGPDRCMVVELPHKDANECLLAGVDYAQMQMIFDNAKGIDPDEFKHLREFEVEAYDQIFGEVKDTGFHAPWDKLDAKFKFRYGELTVINGINGHGKTMAANQVAIEAANQGVLSCVASLEFRPSKLVNKLINQASAISLEEISKDYWKQAFNWLASRMWVFEAVNGAKGDRIIEVFTYARKRYGIRLFIVDSLMKCGFRETDYDSQKIFIEKLCDFKNKYDCHVILITHSKKQEDEKGKINKFDVKGTGAITDLADNVINWMRNKKKESLIQDNPEDAEALQMPDAFLSIEKQRNYDFEGVIGLWFDVNSHQYKSSESTPVKLYTKGAA